MLNKVQIIGNVGQVEIRQSNGKKVASFSIATNENYKDKNGNKVTKVNWFRVAAFSDHYVELIEKYVKKGDRLFIEGSIQNSSYEKDGVTHYNTDIHLTGFNSQLILLTPKPKEDGDKMPEELPPEPAGDKEAEPWPGANDGIPF